MGTNGQAMLSASSSASEADVGTGAPGGFPFVVFSGGAGTEQSAAHPAFAAYARRSVPPDRTARDALALALMEVSGGGDKVDESSYGVTRSPFARVSPPAVVAEIPVAPVAPVPIAPVAQVAAKPAAEPELASVKLTRRRPVLRGETSPAQSVMEGAAGSVVEGALMPVAEVVSAPVAEPAPAMSEAVAFSESPMPLAPIPLPPIPLAPIPEAMPVAPLPPAEPTTAKLKISTRRGGQTAAPVPGVPPAGDAPFLMGPTMEGTRSPLMPLPILSSEQGGVFVPPANPMTRAPFPATAKAATAAPFPFPLAGGVPSGRESPGLAPLVKAKPAPVAATPEDAEASEPSDMMGELAVWLGRVAVVGVVLAFFGLAGYFWKQSPYWPFRMKKIEVTSTPLYHADTPVKAALVVSPAVVAETTSSTAVAQPAVVAATVPEAAKAETVPEPAPVTPPAVVEPVRPPPALAFVGLLERLKITGVLQGEPVRAIIDGRLVQSGDMVDATREVRLIGLDVAKRELLFEDRTTARATVRY